MSHTGEVSAVGGGSPNREQKGTGKGKAKKPKPTKRDSTHYGSLCTKRDAKSSRQRDSRRSYATPEQVDENTQYDEFMTQRLNDEGVGGAHIEDEFDFPGFFDDDSWDCWDI